MRNRKRSSEEKEKQVEIGKTLRALTRACEPFYQTLMADDARHNRDSLAIRMDEFIRKDAQMQKYRDAIMAHTVVERIIASTSAHHFIDDAQMQMFTTENDVREFLNNCTFECGDGTVLRASAVTFDDLEREQARVEKHAQESRNKADERARKLALLRPLMVDMHMSRTDAEIVIWREWVATA